MFNTITSNYKFKKKNSLKDVRYKLQLAKDNYIKYLENKVTDLSKYELELKLQIRNKHILTEAIKKIYIENKQLILNNNKLSKLLYNNRKNKSICYLLNINNCFRNSKRIFPILNNNVPKSDSLNSSIPYSCNKSSSSINNEVFDALSSPTTIDIIDDNIDNRGQWRDNENDINYEDDNGDTIDKEDGKNNDDGDDGDDGDDEDNEDNDDELVKLQTNLTKYLSERKPNKKVYTHGYKNNNQSKGNNQLKSQYIKSLSNYFTNKLNTNNIINI